MPNFLPLLALLFAELCCSAYGVEVVSKNLFISNKELAPDGFQRSTVLAGDSPDGGTFPGPLISGNKGSRFQLNVTDVLTDPTMVRSTSVHWHGFFQKTTNYADGTAFVTQCPIAANHSFLYDFQVPDQAGIILTSRSNTATAFEDPSVCALQHLTELNAVSQDLPFAVIYDPDDPQKHLYDIDDESTVITIGDWFHQTSTQLIAARAQPNASATLFNGKGRYLGGPAVPLAVISVEYGKRYRFRLISISCDANHNVTIDGHNMTVIEVDGENHKPATVNFIQIFPGQRYSFILEANQKVDNYRIRGLASTGVGVSGFVGGINSAILRYVGAPDEEPTTEQSNDTVALTEGLLHPLDDAAAPGGPEPGAADVYVLNLTMNFTAPATFFVNNVTYVPPTVPVLLQILSGKQTAQALLPPGSVYPLPLNKTIEINMFGGDAPGGPHPFHLHGHAFSVVRSADSTEYNFVDPVRRDVTSVAQNNLTTIRFETNNPGPWFLHCHIDLHLEFGLAVVMAEDPGDVKADDPVPPEWDQLCPIYDNLTAAQLP